MALQDKENKLIDELPFPLANLYQKAMYSYATFCKEKNEEIMHPLWNILETAEFCMQFVAFIALSNYDDLKNQIIDFNLNRDLLDSLQDWSPNWLKIAKTICDALAKKQIQDNKLTELLSLLDYKINFLDAIPANFPEKINKYKSYQWFEVMEFFQHLKSYLMQGIYQFQLPGNDIIDFYMQLLTIGLKNCEILHQEFYVLVGRDERKSRGFLCQSTKSRAIGVRGIAETTWKELKGKLFILTSENKNTLSLYPWILPWLVSINGKVAFSDLLFYSYRTKEKIYYYSYRNNNLVSHDVCDTNVLDYWQKWFHWLENHVNRINEQEKTIQTTSNITTEPAKNIVPLSFVPQSYKILCEDLLCKLETESSGYYYFRSNSNRAKENAVNYILSECAKQDSSKYTILYHGFGKQENWCDALLVIKNMFLSIRKNVYGDSIENMSNFLSSFPNNLESLQKYSQQMLNDCSQQVLQPKNRKMVIFLDGMDFLAQSSERMRTFFNIFPKNLPKNIFVLMSWQIQNKKMLLPNSYILDGIPLYQFNDKKIECLELKCSPLLQLQETEILPWLSIMCPFIPKHRQEEISRILWEKSNHGDFRYLALWKESIYQNKIQWYRYSFWPKGHMLFYSYILETLPAQYNNIAYKLLCLLSVLQHECTDAFAAQLFHVAQSCIAPIRWHLNCVLEYTDQGYSLLYWINEYLKTCIPIQEFINIYELLANFSLQQNYKIKEQGEKALYYLPQYLCESNNQKVLYHLLVESSFSEEKLRYFKSYQPYLYDIHQTLKYYYNTQKYDAFLPMMYHYCNVLKESSESMQRTFHAAAHGEYDLALDTLRLHKNENEQFQGMLIILWYSLQNEQYKKSVLILEEFRHIPDENITELPDSIYSFMLLVLQQLKRYSLIRVDYIINKHGKHGKQAIDYLLQLQDKIRFSSSQLRYVLDIIFSYLSEIKEDNDKKEILEKLIPLWKQLESNIAIQQCWDHLFMIIESISDEEKRWECIYSLYLSILNTSLQAYIKKIQEYIKKSDSWKRNGKIWALLLCMMDSEEYFTQSSNDTLVVSLWATLFSIWNENKKKTECYFYLSRILLWNNALSIIPLEQIAILRAMQSNLEQALELIQQTKSINARAKTFAEILPLLSQNKAEESIWYLAFNVFETVTQSKDYLEEIVTSIALGLWECKFSFNDEVWQTYLLTCDSIEISSQKNRVLMYIASIFAQHDFLTKARSLLPKISSAYCRSKVLLNIAMQLVNKKEWDGALDQINEMYSWEDIFQLYAFMSNNLPDGEAGYQLWKKFIAKFLNLEKQNKEGNPATSAIIEILQNLSTKCDWEIVASWWEEIFNCLESVLELENYLEILNSLFSFWIQHVDYARIQPTLQYLEQRVDYWNYPNIIASFYLYYAKALIAWDDISTASNILNKSLDTLFMLDITEDTLEKMVTIASIYKNLGKNIEFNSVIHKIFEIILHQNIKWNIKQFIFHLSQNNLEDIACSLIEHTILQKIQRKEEQIPIDALISLATLCTKAQQKEWTKIFFFRSLSLFSKEEQIQNFVMQVLQNMRQDSEFKKLWESVEAMILNLPTIERQQKCLISLANVLASQNDYEITSILWNKLFYDAQYIGNSYDVLYCFLSIGQYFIKIAPEEEIKTVFLEKNSPFLNYFSEVIEYNLQGEQKKLAHNILKQLQNSATDWNNTFQQALQLKNTWYNNSNNSNILSMPQDIQNALELLEKNNFQEFFKIFICLSKKDVVKFQILQIYTKHLKTEENYEQAFQLLDILEDKEERKILAYGLADTYTRQNNFPGIFRLCLCVLENTDLLYYLTSKILEVIYNTNDITEYNRLFPLITHLWGLDNPYN